MHPIKLGIILFLVLPTSLHSQVLPEEEEAPLALWDWTVGDQEVNLQVKGSWEVNALGGTGFGITSDGLTAPASFPGLTLGWIFTQVPILTLELWLEKKYFFQLNYQGKLETSTFLLGYQGLPGENLRWIKGGTAPFTIPTYADWGIGVSNPGNLQGALGWDGDFSRHDFLVRYETAGKETQTYRGKRESISYRWDLEDWSKEIMYSLPKKNLQGLLILAEDQGGIRPLNPGEAVWNLQEGTITPLNWKAQKFYVTYLGLNAIDFPPGTILTTPLGYTQQFYVIDRQKSLEVLENNNIYTPGTTILPEGEAQVKLVYKNTGEEVSGPWQFIWDSKKRVLRVLGGTDNRHPFEGLYPNLYTSTPPNSENMNHQILLEVISDKEGFNLSPQVKKETLEVTRNGQRVFDYKLDPSTGILDFPNPIFPQDEITITYEVTTGGFSRILGAQGNRFLFSETSWIDTAFWLRWNWDQGSYTTAASQRPGKGNFSLQHIFSETKDNPSINSRLTLLASGGVEDATGLLRWQDMEGSGFPSPLSQRLVRPGAIPGNFDLTTLGLVGYSPPGMNNRGELLYRNLISTDISGYQTLASFDSALPSAPYEEGSFTGPYLAGGFQENKKNLLVLDYRLSGGQWVAAQNYLGEGKSIDYTGVTKISFRRIFAGPVPSNLKIFFQIGEMGEDWDSSGKIEAPQWDPRGLPFHDGRINLVIPTQEYSQQTKDWELKGWLRSESENQVTWEIPQPGNSWDIPWSVSLTEAERKLLKTTNSYRIIILSPLGEPPTEGTYLMEAPLFEGTTFGASGVQIREGADPQSSWGESAPELESLLGAGGGKALETLWTQTTWDARRFNEPIPLKAYRYFGFFVKNPDVQDVTAQIFLGDSRDLGWSADLFIPGNGKWQYFRLNLETGEIQQNGIITSPATSSGIPLNYSQLRLSKNTGPATGKLFWDEFHFQESLFTYGIQGFWNGSYILPLPEFIKARLSWSGETASDGSGAFNPTVLTSSGPFSLSADGYFSKSAEGRVNLQGGYKAGFNSGPLALTQEFSDRGWKKEEISFTGILGVINSQSKMESFFSSTETRQVFTTLLKGIFLDTGSASLDIALGQKSAPPSFWSTPFLTQWMESWQYSWFDDHLPQNRNIQGSTLLIIPWDSLMITTGYTTGLKLGNLLNSYDGSFRFLLEWKEPEISRPVWSASLGWNRNWTTTESLKIISSWVDLTGEVLAKTRDSWEIMGWVPGKEWFSDSLDLPARANSEDLASTLTFKVQRPRLLTWTDFLPGSWESRLHRQIHLEGQGFQTWFLQSSLSTEAPNLFGSKGFIPLFSWYTTDLWRYTLELKNQVTADNKLTQEYGFAPEFQLWDTHGSWGMKSQGTWGSSSWGYKTTGYREWFWYTPGDWKFPYISPTRNYRPKMIQRLSATFTGLESRLLSSALGEFASTWEFTPQGSLLGALKWGHLWRQDLYSTILEVSVKFKLTF